MKLRELIFKGFTGCNDGYCIISGKASGMHTNGGCHCMIGFNRSQLQIISSRFKYNGEKEVVIDDEDLTSRINAYNKVKDENQQLKSRVTELEVCGSIAIENIEKICSFNQDFDLLWWQELARESYFLLRDKYAKQSLAEVKADCIEKVAKELKQKVELQDNFTVNGQNEVEYFDLDVCEFDGLLERAQQLRNGEVE